MPALNINVSEHIKHVSKIVSKPEHETSQTGVYRIDEDDDIHTVLKMFDKPEK